jgi:rubrerythrin
MNSDRPQAVCFLTGTTPRSIPAPVAHRLADEHATALAELLQILCCSEESAVLAFGRLSHNPRLDASAKATLATIASEEAVHEVLLGNLRHALPVPAEDENLRRVMRHFFRSLGGRDLGLHFAQLAALDSGVCAILAALRAGSLPLSRESSVARILERIHRDEARHTASALRIASHLPSRERLLDEANTVRRKLVDLVLRRADAMERLGVDADLLARRLVTIPNSFAR